MLLIELLLIRCNNHYNLIYKYEKQKISSTRLT